MALPAQTQQVRYSWDMGGQTNPFLTLLSAFGTGMMEKQNLNQKLIQSSFPNLIATKQIRPAQKGEQTILPNVPWAWNSSLDVDDLTKQATLKQKLLELDPNWQASEAAYKATLDQSKNVTQQNAMLSALGKTGVIAPPDWSDKTLKEQQNLWKRAHNLPTDEAPTMEMTETVVKPGTKLDKKKAMIFLQQANGDTVLARKLAIKAGYTLDTL